MRKPARTQKSILAYFAVGIGLPSLVLGFLAFRGIQNDRALFERASRNDHLRATEEIAHALSRYLDDIDQAAALLLTRLNEQPSNPERGFGDTIRAVYPCIDLLFTFDSLGTVQVPWPTLPFLPDKGAFPPVRHSSLPTVRTLVEQADRLAFHDHSYDEALANYREALELSTSPSERGVLLLGIARTQRTLGLLREAKQTYGRLGRECPSELLAGGIPGGLIGEIESAAIDAASGDTVASLWAFLRLYEDLLDRRWQLEQAPFNFCVATLSQNFKRLGPRGSPEGAIGERFRLLEERERRVRESVRHVFSLAAQAPRLLAPQTGPHRTFTTTRPIRFTAALDSSTYLISLLPLLDRTRRPTHGFGVLLSTACLCETYVPRLINRHVDSTTATWWLVDRSGKQLAGLQPDPRSSPSATASFDEGLPPWALQVFLREGALSEQILSPRRTIFVVMFALVIIIFLFGLILTYRSVEHQLDVAKLKSDFVSTVSHEFKSPVTSIRQLAEMLQANRVPSEERRRQYYDVIVEQSERISLLIDNVLNFARMEEGKKAFRFELTDVAPLLRDVAARLQHQVSHTGFRIRVAVDTSLPLVRVDRLSFAEAVVNLLDNAVKYSGASDVVELRARVVDRSLAVSVHDFGIGIPPGDIDRVFERFYRGGEAMSRSVSGAGLGLTLVKQIVTAHHGSIHVKSTVGQGSTFEIRLPLPQD